MEARSKPARSIRVIGRAGDISQRPQESPVMGEPAEDVLFIIHNERTETGVDEIGHESDSVYAETMMREISGHLAEELSGPLATLELYAQLLLAGSSLDDTSRQGLERICDEARQAGETITGLLSFARERKPDRALVSIEDIIYSSLRASVAGIDAGSVDIALEIQPDLPWIMADPELLQRAFVNIVKNARTAVAESGGAGRIRIRAAEAGGTVRVVFEDNGPGMSQDVIQRLFEPFFTTREAGKGMGLGLTLSYSTVKKHGGSIYAMSTPGKGSTIVVEFPHLSPD